MEAVWSAASSNVHTEIRTGRRLCCPRPILECEIGKLQPRWCVSAVVPRRATVRSRVPLLACDEGQHTDVPNSSGTAGWASSPCRASHCAPRRLIHVLYQTDVSQVSNVNVDFQRQMYQRSEWLHQYHKARVLFRVILGDLPPPAPPPVGGNPIRVPVHDLKYTCRRPWCKTQLQHLPRQIERGAVHCN